MKLTLWEPKSSATAEEMKSDFARKLGAFRAATGRPERFVTRCACAIHDKGFTVVYERTDPARPFILTGIYKDGEGEVASGTGTARTRTLSASEVDHAGWRCPYCGNDRHIDCTGCHTGVCGGKTRRYPGTGDIFTCRASCGARGTLVECPTVTGTEARRRPVVSQPFAERLAAPGSDLVRLGSTKTPRAK
jgi:hypothetical protein